MKKIIFIIGFCLATLFVSANNGLAKGNLAYNYLQDTLIKNTSNILFSFEFNKADFNIDYMSNRKSFEQLDKVLADTSLVFTIDTINIIITASPEGRYSYNKTLADKRAVSFQLMLLEYYPFLSDVTMTIGSYVTDWSKLKKLIKNDYNIPYRDAVISTLDKDRDYGAISWLLQQIGDGESWQYISNKYMHLLRMSNMTIKCVYKKKIAEPLFFDTLNTPNTPNTYIITNNDILPILSNRVPKIEAKRKDFLAIKTNLLFNAASLINLELEVPIGKRWSIAGEYIFPWWTFDNGKADSKRNRIQLLNVNLEGRYWFGNRDSRPKMTGWFAGFYVGGGLYDFERSAKGYQGEFFIMGGISGGYVHTINKKGNLRMEYSLGVGYLQTDYRYYESHFSPTNEWHPMYKLGGRYSWIGPTKLKVSLVWMLNKKERRR